MPSLAQDCELHMNATLGFAVFSNRLTMIRPCERYSSMGILRPTAAMDVSWTASVMGFRGICPTEHARAAGNRGKGWRRPLVYRRNIQGRHDCRLLIVGGTFDVPVDSRRRSCLERTSSAWIGRREERLGLKLQRRAPSQK